MIDLSVKFITISETPINLMLFYVLMLVILLILCSATTTILCSATTTISVISLIKRCSSKTQLIILTVYK